MIFTERSVQEGLKIRLIRLQSLHFRDDNGSLGEVLTQGNDCNRSHNLENVI